MSSSQSFLLLAQFFSSFLPNINRFSLSTHPAFLLLSFLHHVPYFSIFLHSLFHFLNLIHRFSLPSHPVISPHADSTPSLFIEVFSFPFFTVSCSLSTVCVTIQSFRCSLSLRVVSVPEERTGAGGSDNVRMSSMFAWWVFTIITVYGAAGHSGLFSSKFCVQLCSRQRHSLTRRRGKSCVTATK